MGTIVEIDEMDKKILGMLIKDARARLKDIAKDCGVSSVSILNRIKRLENLGVISGATILPNLDFLGNKVPATIGVETESNQDQIIEFVREHPELIALSECVGKYDLTALVISDNIFHLEKVVSEVKRIRGVRKVTVNVWSGRPHFTLENIDLEPRKCDGNGKNRPIGT